MFRDTDISIHPGSRQAGTKICFKCYQGTAQQNKIIIGIRKICQTRCTTDVSWEKKDFTYVRVRTDITSLREILICQKFQPNDGHFKHEIVAFFEVCEFYCDVK